MIECVTKCIEKPEICEHNEDVHFGMCVKGNERYLLPEYKVAAMFASESVHMYRSWGVHKMWGDSPVPARITESCPEAEEVRLEYVREKNAN